jgi:hypothetical protein
MFLGLQDPDPLVRYTDPDPLIRYPDPSTLHHLSADTHIEPYTDNFDVVLELIAFVLLFISSKWGWGRVALFDCS